MKANSNSKTVAARFQRGYNAAKVPNGGGKKWRRLGRESGREETKGSEGRGEG